MSLAWGEVRRSLDVCNLVGCDVIAAYALAQHIKKVTPVEHVVVANAKGPIPNKSHYTQVTPNILRVSPVMYTINKGESCYGSSKIEESLPRGTDGCPFVISLPTKHDVKKNTETLIPEIQSLKFTSIIGIDMGGDSISGGIDHPGDASLGRDMQFKTILASKQ